MQKQNETAQQKLCTGRHQYREWNLTQSVEAQTMFVKCFWNILWWVIEVVNYIKSTEHKSDSFQPRYRLFPIVIPCKHLRSCHPFGLLILLCGPASPAWFISCVSYIRHSSLLLLAYTCLISFADSLPLETSCYQVTESQRSGSLLVVTVVTLCSTDGVMVYR